MKIVKKINGFINDPKIRFNYLSRVGLLNWMNDEKFIRRKWRLCFNREIDLDNPKTFNEKMQWLKLHDRKDVYTTMVDKIEVKKYVSNIIGEEYIIPTIGVYERFEDIDLIDLSLLMEQMDD